MKVVEYWHGTIKNYTYDEEVSACYIVQCGAQLTFGSFVVVFS